MVMIGWLIVVDRAKPSMADAAWCVHGFEPGAVFSAEITVAVSWVTHDDHLGIKKEQAHRLPFFEYIIICDIFNCKHRLIKNLSQFF